MNNDCIICYSNNEYPLLSMSYIYKCKCRKYYGHNRCLINVNKCPTCRKESKPYLYIYTKYDYYFYYLLNWLKKDILNIYKLHLLIIYIFIIICELIFTSNEFIIYYYVILYSLLFGFILFLLTELNNYLKIYWLFDGEKYNVFN